MTLGNYFNPYDLLHVRAYKTIRNTGTWPQDFIPQFVDIEPEWEENIRIKIVNSWIDTMLGDV